MKKVLFSGIMMGVLGATSTMADTTAQLTTKGYVDEGLKAVYNKAKGLANEAKEIAQTAKTTADTAKTTADAASAAVGVLKTNLDELDAYVGNPSGIVDGQQVAATGLTARVEKIESDVGDKNNLNTTTKSDLVGAINEIQGAVNTINTTIAGQKVEAGAGVKVSGSTVSVDGLNETTAADTDGIYVFQGNKATKLNIASDWSAPEWLN